MSEAHTMLEMRAIEKQFNRNQVLKKANFSLRKGEVHALMGGNGAGKSTLMKILTGVYTADGGEILIDGQAVTIDSPTGAEALGVAMIFQEFSLVPTLTVAQNIYLNREPRSAGGLLIDDSELVRRAQAILDELGEDIDASLPVSRLSVGMCQIVEIAKALSKQVQLLILDEPTASLNETDSEALLQLLRELKAQGIACILISHKLNEIAKVADTITVLRDGATITTLDCSAGPASEDVIIRAMVGREMADRYPRRTPKIGETVFELRDWRVHHPLHREREVVKGVNLRVGRGEIVCIAGLMGAGRTELAMSVFGRSWGQRISGKAFVEGREADLSTVQKAVDAGIAYVTEDRKSLGLVLSQSIATNTTLANLGGVSRRGVIDDVL